MINRHKVSKRYIWEIITWLNKIFLAAFSSPAACFSKTVFFRNIWMGHKIPEGHREDTDKHWKSVTFYRGKCTQNLHTFAPVKCHLTADFFVLAEQEINLNKGRVPQAYYTEVLQHLNHFSARWAWQAPQHLAASNNTRTVWLKPISQNRKKILKKARNKRYKGRCNGFLCQVVYFPSWGNNKLVVAQSNTVQL